MTRSTRFILAFLGLNILLLCFNNCSPLHDPGLANFSLSSASLDTDSAAAQKAVQILSVNCASCHGSSSGLGGVSDITDLSALVAQGLMVPGNSASSPLMQQVQSGAMPPTGKLADADILALQTWVEHANEISDTPAPSPTPSPSPGGGPVTAATFSSISATILIPRCVSCHGSTVANGGFRFDNYANVMMAVQAGNLSASLLYTQTASGAMPTGGPILSTADLQYISAWITDGAKNN